MQIRNQIIVRLFILLVTVFFATPQSAFAIVSNAKNNTEIATQTTENSSKTSFWQEKKAQIKEKTTKLFKGGNASSNGDAKKWLWIGLGAIALMGVFYIIVGASGGSIGFLGLALLSGALGVVSLIIWLFKK